MKSRQIRIAILSLSCLLITVLSGAGIVFGAEGQKEPDEYIVKFKDGTGITLRYFKKVIRDQSEAKGLPPMKDSEKRDVLRILTENELVYRDAVKAGIDKDAEVKAQIELATRQVVLKAFFQKFWAENFKSASEDDAKKYYSENLANYHMLDIYSGTVFYVNRKNFQGENVSDKSRAIAEEFKSYLFGKDIVGSIEKEDDALLLFAQKFPDVRIEKYRLPSYRRGSPIIVSDPILNAFTGLKPGEITVVEADNANIVVALQKITPGEPTSFELAKPEIIAKLNKAKQEQLFKEFIDKLSIEYQITIDESLISK